MHTPGNLPAIEGLTYHPASRPPSNPSNRTAKHSRFFAPRSYGTSSALIGCCSAALMVASQNDSKSSSRYNEGLYCRICSSGMSMEGMGGEYRGGEGVTR